MITLTKHHGLGNDFLVCDVAQCAAVMQWPRLAQQWCDRRQGIGADGLLLLGTLGENELTMVLFNADGSRAEMSGNGIRCVVQAAVVAQHRRGEIDYVVHTDAGIRAVQVTTDSATHIMASVAMGSIRRLEEPQGWSAIGADPARPVMHLDLGNPHAVVAVDDVAEVDLLTLGKMVPHVNLEIVQPTESTAAIRMRVHERGAGITQACGTGACASAWAAAKWGLATPVNGEIHVQMDGGAATVRLDHPEPGHVTLVGPAVLIGHIQIEDS